MIKMGALLMLMMVSTSTFAARENAPSDPGVTVDAKVFMAGVQGEYQILLAGGVKPKEGSSKGKIIADKDEGIFVMPYCISETDPCDPGYVFFNYSNVIVTKWELEPDHNYYTLVLNDSGVISRYGWEQSACSVTFTNFQYLPANSQTPTTLQHILKKK